MDAITTADWVIIALFLGSGILSWWRGFTREAISLATWVTAFVVGRLFSPALETVLSDYIDVPSARYPIAFVLLVIATLIIGALLARLLKQVVKATGLGTLDRLLGMVFGVARAAVILVVLVAVTREFFMQDAWWQRSELIPHLLILEEWSREVGHGLMSQLLNTGS